jgi:hypothetical protein
MILRDRVVGNANYLKLKFNVKQKMNAFNFFPNTTMCDTRRRKQLKDKTYICCIWIVFDSQISYYLISKKNRRISFDDMREYIYKHISTDLKKKAELFLRLVVTFLHSYVLPPFRCLKKLLTCRLGLTIYEAEGDRKKVL